MRILGSVPIPFFTNDSRVSTVVVRVVQTLPYAFILGADYSPTNRGTLLDFVNSKRFRPTPSAPWVPFLKKGVDCTETGSMLREPRARFCSLTEHPQPPIAAHRAHLGLATDPEPQSIHDIAWADAISTEWDLRPVDSDVSVKGFTSIPAEAAPVGPVPQDQQLAMVLPK